MKKKIENMIAQAADLSAKFACNSTSLIGLYQPAMPKELQKNNKTTKK